MVQIAAYGGNVHGTSPLCPTAGDYGFCKNIILSVQFGENMPISPDVIKEGVRWTYAITSTRSVTAKFTLL